MSTERIDVEALRGELWVAFKDRWPKASSALDDASVKNTDAVLVTNNLQSRDRMGRMSHVWYVRPTRSHESAEGEVVAFTDSDRKIHGLTHWLDIDSLLAEVIERRARDAELIADLRQAIDDVKIVRRVDGDGMEFGSIRKLDDVERSLAAAIAAIQGAQP